MKGKYLVELFLPLFDNDGKPFNSDLFSKINEELIKHFGGLTCHSRSPAMGIWKAGDKKVDVDQIIIYGSLRMILINHSGLFIKVLWNTV